MSVQIPEAVEVTPDEVPAVIAVQNTLKSACPASITGLDAGDVVEYFAVIKDSAGNEKVGSTKIMSVTMGSDSNCDYSVRHKAVPIAEEK